MLTKDIYIRNSKAINMMEVCKQNGFMYYEVITTGYDLLIKFEKENGIENLKKDIINFYNDIEYRKYSNNNDIKRIKVNYDNQEELLLVINKLKELNIKKAIIIYEYVVYLFYKQYFL